MNDNTTPRDAIENVIDSTAHSMSRWTGYTSEEVWLDNPDECADAVIDYLWQRADDPEMVEAVLSAVVESFPAFTPSGERILGGVDYDLCSDIAISATVATLTALLGPRPAEQESHDE